MFRSLSPHTSKDPSLPCYYPTLLRRPPGPYPQSCSLLLSHLEMEVQSLPATYPDGLDSAQWHAGGANWGEGGKLRGRLAALTLRSS